MGVIIPGMTDTEAMTFGLAFLIEDVIDVAEVQHRLVTHLATSKGHANPELLAILELSEKIHAKFSRVVTLANRVVTLAQELARETEVATGGAPQA